MSSTSIVSAQTAIGNHDSATCLEVTGWACMPSQPNTAIDVHIYKNKSYWDGGSAIGSAKANIQREAAVGSICGGNSAHGFSFVVPAGTLALNDKVYVHAINNGDNPLLWNTGKTITSCATQSTTTSCQRCSNTNGCEMAKFQSSDTSCMNPVGDVERWTDTSNCGPITGGNNSRCNATPTPTPAQSSSSSCPSIESSIGSIDLPISLPTHATYTVWVRMKPAGDTANAVYMKFDNNCPIVVGDRNGMPSNTWQWVNYSSGQVGNIMKVPLSAGVHTITFMGKESHVRIDRVILAKDSCIPEGVGDNCSTSQSSPTVVQTQPASPTPTPKPLATATPTPKPVMTTIPSPTTISGNNLLVSDIWALRQPISPGENLNISAHVKNISTAEITANNMYLFVFNGQRTMRLSPTYNLVFKPGEMKTISGSVTTSIDSTGIWTMQVAATTPLPLTYAPNATNKTITISETAITPSPATGSISQNNMYTITIYAAGTRVWNTYPIMDLFINGVRVKRFRDITSNYQTKPYQEYTYTTSLPVTPSTIRVAFANDAYTGFADRNLYVDKISVNGKIIETESETLVTGSACGQTLSGSEILYCNGYFDFTLIK